MAEEHREHKMDDLGGPTTEAYAQWAKQLVIADANTDQGYQGHPDPLDTAADALAVVLSERQLWELTERLLEHQPGLMQRFSEELLGEFLGELKEEMYRRMETGEVSGTPVELVEAIEANWKQEG